MENYEYLPKMKRPKYRFSYLDLSQFDAIEASVIQTKLSDAFDKIRDSYQGLLNAITKSMKMRDTRIVEIVNSVSHFDTLKPVNDATILDRPVLKFEDQFPKLLCATSIDEFMLNIREYSSFFSYGLIKIIIESLGTDEDKTKLRDYEKKFEEYACHTVFECPELGIACSSGRTRFLVKVLREKGFDECSVSHLRTFVNKLSEILAECHEGMLLPESVVPGCLELRLHVPQLVFQLIFPLSSRQEQALANIGVIKISAGNYQYPHSQGDSDDKDDKPDDGDSAIGTLSTIMSELSRSEFKQVSLFV